MIRSDARFVQAVEAAVTRIEKDTSAEVVVVAALRSGSYRDVALASGAVAAWLVLIALAVSPIVFSPLWTAVDVAIVFGVATWIANRLPRFLARVTTTARQRKQCADAARASFIEEGVDRTVGRTGVLVYLSLLERRVVVIPDAGVLGSVPTGEVAAIRWGTSEDYLSATSVEDFLAGLDALGAAVARGLPARGANPDERPNAPRVKR